jgi:hypothetical protein
MLHLLKTLNMEKNYRSSFRWSILMCFCFSFTNITKAQTVMTANYSAPGSVYSFTVPPCVYQMTVDIRGAKGGTGYDVYSQGGFGGRVTAVIPVTMGQVLQIRVGGAGANASSLGGGAGGYNGGGLGATYSGLYGGGGGGGASDIRISPFGLSNRIIVGAGGGGGAFDYSTQDSERGGDGGGTIGENGYWGSSSGHAYAGGGATQTAGGTAGYFASYCGANTGSLGIGGDAGSCTNSGGGGGGGWYGGGGGVWGGGGGGSNYALSTASNVVHTRGSQTGNGVVSFTYVLNGNAVAAALTPTAICIGSSATLTAGSVSTYTWSNGSQASSIVVSPLSTTAYTVQGTNSTGCTSTVVLTVSVSSAPPSLSVNSSTNSTCCGKAVMLTATGGLAYSWTGGVVNGVPFTPTGTSGYTVTGYNGCGSGTASATISVGPLPVGVSATNTLICQLNTVTLTATGGTSYTWTPTSMTVSSIMVSPAASTIYTVSAFDGTCSGMATVTITTKPNPTITVVASSQSVCEGKTATITAYGADNYTWLNAPITGSTGVITPTASALYQVTGTNNVGCSAIGSQVVILSPSPVVNAVANRTLVCSGGSSTVMATGNATGYSWNTGGTTYTDIVTPIVTTAYTVTGASANGCTTEKQVTVNVFQPVLNTSASSTICEGASITLTAGPGNGFQWTPGPPSFANSIVVQVLQPTTYTVSATSMSNGVSCTASNTIFVGVNSKPVVTSQATRTVMCRSRESIPLTVSGASTYVWLHNNSTNTSTSFTSNIIQTHNIMVIGTDVNGCSDTAIVSIKVNACTSISENQAAQEGISIYPNPASDAFTVRSVSDISLALTNELGQIIQTITLSSGNNYQVNVESLSAGIYFLRGHNDGHMICEKIVVSK